MCAIVPSESDVVLTSEVEIINHFEVARLAVQAPDDFARLVGNLENGITVSAREEIVAFGRFIDRVRMHIVPASLAMPGDIAFVGR